MAILQTLLTLIFLVSVGFYLYYFTRRTQRDVVIKMWMAIVVGMLAGMASQLMGVKLGKISWSSVQLGVYLYSALLLYSLWKLTQEWKKRRH